MALKKYKNTFVSSLKAFIVSSNSTIDYLNSFDKVRFTTKTRYHSMHVVSLPTHEIASDERIAEILNHPVVKGCVYLEYFSKNLILIFTFH